MTQGNGLFRRTGMGDQPVHLKVLISGPPKSGKTTTLGTVPNIIVLDTEPDANNIESIAHLGIAHVEIRSTQELKQVLFLLAEPTMRKQVAAQYGWDDVGAVAIDTLDTLQRIMKRERMTETHKGEFTRDDWGWLKTEMQSVVQNFTKLPMHVFFTVHLGSKEIGKGDNAYQQVTVGLEGAIAGELPGMVGYSLLSFRQPVIQSDGTTKTEYFLRAEGDQNYDFLGTRTAGRLPAVIRPDMAHIYNAVMEGRRQAAESAPQEPQPFDPMELPAQNPGQVQTSVQTPPPPPAPYDAPQQQMPGPGGPTPTQAQPQQPAPAGPPVSEQAPGQPGKPADDEPANAAALVHAKRIYDAMQLPFPEEKLKVQTIGTIRNLARYWGAAQQDAAAGTGPDAASAMFEILKSHGLLPDDNQVPEQPAAPAEPKIDGTIPEVEAYVMPNGEVDLTRVQEAYNLESQRVNSKGEPAARKSLVTKLESLGAQPQQVQQQPPAQQMQQPQYEPGGGQVGGPGVQGGPVETMPVVSTASGEPVVHQQPIPAQSEQQIQTPVQTQQAPPQGPPQGVTPPTPAADPSTGGIGDPGGQAAMEQAVQTVQQSGLSGQVISQGVTEGAVCAKCGKPYDDVDLANLAVARFQQVLCVEHYLEATRAGQPA